MTAVSTQGITGKPHSRTYQAGAANQLRGLAVIQGADDLHVVTAAAANANGLGIQEESSVNVGDVISVTLAGEAIGIAGAAVAANLYVIANAQGQLVPSAAAGDFVIGRALSSAAVAGDEFVVLVDPFIR